jgi:hypothetical protein
MVNNDIVGYIRNVPANYVPHTIPDKQIPKKCWKLEYVLNIGAVNDAEIKKYKKRLEDPTIWFKIEMVKTALYKGKEKVRDSKNF